MNAEFLSCHVHKCLAILHATPVVSRDIHMSKLPTVPHVRVEGVVAAIVVVEDGRDRYFVDSQQPSS
jgi:hypothetical protein